LELLAPLPLPPLLLRRSGGASWEPAPLDDAGADTVTAACSANDTDLRLRSAATPDRTAATSPADEEKPSPAVLLWCVEADVSEPTLVERASGVEPVMSDDAPAVGREPSDGTLEVGDSARAGWRPDSGAATPAAALTDAAEREACSEGVVAVARPLVDEEAAPLPPPPPLPARRLAPEAEARVEAWAA